MIGSNEVVMYGEAHCLILGKQWLSISKIKAVLANLEACREFLIKYDVKPAAPAAPAPLPNAEKEALLKQIRELEQRAAGIAAQQNGAGRLDPVKA